MKTLLSLFSVLLLAVSAGAQTARVQIIHNAPDPTVDIYVNGFKALEDFAFRTATSFLELPAGIGLTVAVAPANSASSMDAIASFPVTFESGKTYAITASGIVGDPNTPFTLIADDNARQTAADPAKVDLNVLHGSPDAPAVDVVVRTGGKIVSNAAYGNFTPYLSVDPGVYYLDVKPAGGSAIVQTFKADLSGLTGQAIRVFASGLLNGAPGFGLFAALSNGTVVELPASPVARVQVIHNSPNPTVDVWANDGRLIDDFTYRSATPFIFVPAGVDIDLGIAADTSTSAASSLAVFPVNLENGRTYVVTANGYLGDPDFPFTLVVNPDGREAASDTGNVDIAIIHGALQAPQSVDVDAVFAGNNVITGLELGAYTPYLSLTPEKYDFAVRAAGTQAVSGTFRADLSGLKGAAAYVFVADLLGGDPAFGLFAALPNGDVVQLTLTPTARVQVIHNAPDPVVDVYAGNTLLLDDFAFRTATPFVDLPADRDIQLGVAPAGSTSAADAIATFSASFMEDNAYAITAVGVVGDPGRPFTVVVDANAREAAADPGKVDFNVLHGSPDAPAVDIDVVGVGNIVPNLSYPEQTAYLSVDPASYLIQVRPAGSPAAVGTFQADLSGLAGGAARVFASGFLGGTPAFGLFAALPDGAVVEFPAVTPPATARVQVIHNGPDLTVDIYANDDILIDDFDYRTATPFISVPANVAITIGVAPGNSQSAGDAIATFPVTFEENKTYVVTASGLIGDPNTPFTLIVDDNGREAAADSNQVDIAVLHGSTNAPAVDVDAVFVANNVVSNLAYGSFTPYLGLTPDKYDFAIRAAGDPNVVASFRADLSGLKGGAAYVFASGLLGGTPAFGLFAALPTGDVLPLPLTPAARVQVLHNAPSPTVDVYAGNTLLLDNFAFRTATPYIDFPADRDVAVGIAPGNSTSVADAIATFGASFATGGTYLVAASGVVGSTATPFTLIIDDEAAETAPAGTVGISVLHGAPDAPPVDVAERLGGTFVSNLAYGNFTAYLDIPAADGYYLDVKPAGSDQILATYRADISGFEGQAIRVFASGFLSGSTPAFGLYVALPDGTVAALPFEPVARVQIIHNAPAPTVDVYAGAFLLLDDFEFQDATPFGYFPAGIQIGLSVAPENSSSPGDAFYGLNYTFENGKTYVVVASGIFDDDETPFDLIINDMGREQPEDDTKIEFAILHGVPDAPAVDLLPLGAPAPIVSNLEYGTFLDYLTLDPDVLLLDVVPTANPRTAVGTWGADLSGVPGLVGVVMASGLLNGDPEMDLVLVLPNGFVLPLPAFARSQVIHNSPGAAAGVVDVYLDDDIALDNLGFRQATGIGLLPARVPFNLAVAPGNSTSADDAIYTLPVNRLETGKTYLLMAAGVVGDPNTPFQLYVNQEGRDRALSASDVDLILFHGSPDAPEVDVKVLGGPVLFDNLAFGDFSDYVSVPPAEYVVQVTPADDNNTVVQSYRADISALGGQAATIFASGFLGGAQPAFEVWAALANGFTFPLPVFVNTNELDGKLESLQLSPNPAVDNLLVRFNLNEDEALRYNIRDLTGRLTAEGDFGLVPAGEFAAQLNLGGAPSGMYQLEIVSDAGVQVRKFVVQGR